MTDKPEDSVFIGVEDGVSTYVKRENMTGIDHAMMRDASKRSLAAKTERKMHNWAKANPVEYENMLKRMGK
jgi:hypothetical protein